MRKIIFSLFAMLLLATCGKKDAVVVSSPAENNAITKRTCAADEVLQREIAEDPARGRFLEQLEAQTRDYAGRLQRTPGKLYIGVVVHVVLTDPSMVSDAQIQSQINVLNEDYSAENNELNSPHVYLAGYNYNNVGNCDLEFYLAQVVRKQTNVAAFSTNNGVKRSNRGGSDAVDPGTKLNIWVCNMSGGILGYAQFPGGNLSTDGVVINYRSFGTVSPGNYLYEEYDLGRTTTHEIGHWLNLRHIWGDRRCGTDQVDDTPQHDTYNFGCPPVGHTSLCSGNPLEQWMNYMDYTDDACMYMFTGGQKIRIDAAIDNARAPWVSTTR